MAMGWVGCVCRCVYIQMCIQMKHVGKRVLEECSRPFQQQGQSHKEATLIQLLFPASCWGPPLFLHQSSLTSHENKATDEAVPHSLEHHWPSPWLWQSPCVEPHSEFTVSTLLCSSRAELLLTPWGKSWRVSSLRSLSQDLVKEFKWQRRVGAWLKMLSSGAAMQAQWSVLWALRTWIQVTSSLLRSVRATHTYVSSAFLGHPSAAAVSFLMLAT